MDRRTYLKTQGLTISGIFFSGSVIGILQSCSAENDPDWTPYFLTEKELRITSELAEMILPKTDTPGAKDVGVARRIDEALYLGHESEDLKMYRDGIQLVEKVSMAEIGKSILDASQEEKGKAMQALIIDSQTNKNEFVKHIYPFLKGLVLVAYFTSEKVGKDVLMYDPIPGEFNGRVPLSAIGRVWSLK